MTLFIARGIKKISVAAFALAMTTVPT
ncbi:trhZ, partial [Klebsiella pneumoniae]|nr:trhZ [Klebsiella pneumoniae]